MVSTRHKLASASIAGTSWIRFASTPTFASRSRRLDGGEVDGVPEAVICRCKMTSRPWHFGTRRFPPHLFLRCPIETIWKWYRAPVPGVSDHPERSERSYRSNTVLGGGGRGPRVDS